MKTKPVISIIVPSYNVELYLKDCIDSIIQQTYQYWELILVNDGSTDKTPQLCDQYAVKDKRIKVIHKPNGGLVSARNAGYEVATGKWIMYVDSDDWIDTETCEKLLVYAEKHNPEVIFWNSIQELNGESIKGKYGWKCSEKEHIYLDEECKDLARNTLVYKSGIATAYSKLIRKDFIEKNKLWHNNKLKQGAEGLEFSLRVFDCAQKALFVDEYFYHYRYNENSISKRVDEKNTQYLLECFEEIDKYISQNGLDKQMWRLFHQRVLYVLIAIGLNTYFHKDNKDPLRIKIKKYKKVINENPIFKNALSKGVFNEFDKLRFITLYIIKLKLYFLLSFISSTKQYLIKKGFFSY